MGRPSHGVKLFTVEEANRLLPVVQQSLKVLRQGQDRIRKCEGEKAAEELSWLRADGTVSPKAKVEVARLEKEISHEMRGFEEEIEKLNSLGAQLKDLEEGLVDFFTSRGGELVYLCWKEGEDRVRFWHDMESGFAGRQPVESL